MSLRTEIQEYLDKDWFVTPQKGVGSNNGLLYSSLYYIVLVKNGLATLSDLSDFAGLMKSCELEPGLFKRNGACTDQEGPDDYIGLTTAAYLMQSVISKDVLAYAEKHNYILNNVGPGTLYDGDKINWSAFFFRMPAFVAHLHFAAGKRPSLFYKLAWAVTVATSGKNPLDQDSRLLSWMLIEAAKGKSTICDLAAEMWRNRLKREWPGGMKQVLGACLCPEHPITKYFVE